MLPLILSEVYQSRVASCLKKVVNEGRNSMKPLNSSVVKRSIPDTGTPVGGSCVVSPVSSALPSPSSVTMSVASSGTPSATLVEVGGETVMVTSLEAALEESPSDHTLARELTCVPYQGI